MRSPLLRPVLAAGLLVALAFAGCAGRDRDEADASDKLLPPTPAPFASYLHDLSVPDKSLSVVGGIVEQYRTAVDELIELDTWVVRPDVEGPVPLVMTFTPYYGGGSPIGAAGHAFGRLGDELLPRGYAVGVSSVRGTGNSGGCFTQGGAQEARDTAAVIEHLAGQSWSNGNVGMIGVSYDGTTPQDAWVESSPSLKAVVPIAGISDLYKYNFVNGVPINVQGFGFNTYYWALVGLVPFPLGATGNADPASIPGAVAGEACTDQVSVQEGGVSSTLDGNKDAYWQERDFLAELKASPDKERASVFYIHGLQDWNVKDHHMEDWLEAVQDTGVPFKAWLGQCGHNWPQSTDPATECSAKDYGDRPTCRNDWWTLGVVAWFDQFLKGVDTGILDAPAVQVQDDDFVWRHEARWPPADVEWLKMFPHDDGTLAATPGDGSVSYFDGFGGLVGGATPATPPGLLPLGQPSVVFRSERLTEDLHLSGLPRFIGNVTASSARASLVLTLAEERRGDLRAINFAAQSLNHVASLESGDSDISGLRQMVAVDFFPQDDVILKGSRLVLIAAGNSVEGDQPGPSLQPLSTGSTITLELSGARLELPIDRSIVPENPQPYGA